MYYGNTPQIFGFLFILGGGFISNHSSAQSLNFSLQSSGDRSYTCSGNVATFVCSGVGNDLSFYAPPFVNISSPIQYLRGDNIGAGAFVHPLTTNLISTSYPNMVAQLTVIANTTVRELTILCIVRSPSKEREVFFRREGKYKDYFCLLRGVCTNL